MVNFRFAPGCCDPCGVPCPAVIQPSNFDILAGTYDLETKTLSPGGEITVHPEQVFSNWPGRPYFIGPVVNGVIPANPLFDFAFGGKVFSHVIGPGVSTQTRYFFYGSDPLNESPLSMTGAAGKTSPFAASNGAVNVSESGHLMIDNHRTSIPFSEALPSIVNPTNEWLQIDAVNVYQFQEHYQILDPESPFLEGIMYSRSYVPGNCNIFPRRCYCSQNDELNAIFERDSIDVEISGLEGWISDLNGTVTLGRRYNGSLRESCVFYGEFETEATLQAYSDGFDECGLRPVFWPEHLCWDPELVDIIVPIRFAVLVSPSTLYARGPRICFEFINDTVVLGGLRGNVNDSGRYATCDYDIRPSCQNPEWSPRYPEQIFPSCLILSGRRQALREGLPRDFFNPVVFPVTAWTNNPSYYLMASRVAPEVDFPSCGPYSWGSGGGSLTQPGNTPSQPVNAINLYYDGVRLPGVNRTLASGTWTNQFWRYPCCEYPIVNPQIDPRIPPDQIVVPVASDLYSKIGAPTIRVLRPEEGWLW